MREGGDGDTSGSQLGNIILHLLRILLHIDLMSCLLTQIYSSL